MGMKLSGKHAERIKGIEGEALEKLIFKNVRELLIRSTEIIPVVIVIEDLHWADASSLILIDALYRLSRSQKVVFINVFRPGYWDDAEKTPVSLKDRAADLSLVELVLQPLDSLSSEALINNMLSIKGLHHGVKAQIIERAGGNPFFIRRGGARTHRRWCRCRKRRRVRGNRQNPRGGDSPDDQRCLDGQDRPTR